MDAAQNRFEGWAVVELFGHAKEVGFVTTQYFGTACLFQIDVPELPERDYVLQRPEWAVNHTNGEDQRYAPVGAKVRRSAVPARSRLVGPGAVYSMTPCTEETARRAIEDLVRRSVILLEMPKGIEQALLPGEADAVEEEEAYVRDEDI